MFFGVILACALSVSGSPSNMCIVMKDTHNPYADKALCLIEIEKNISLAKGPMSEIGAPYLSGDCYTESELVRFTPAIRKKILDSAKNVY